MNERGFTIKTYETSRDCLCHRNEFLKSQLMKNFVNTKIYKAPV